MQVKGNIRGLMAPRLAWARAEIDETHCAIADRFPDAEHPLRKRAEAILKNARKTPDIDAKWLFVYRAREILIYDLDRDEIDVAACSLRALATRPGDLTGGRRAAVLALVEELKHEVADHEGGPRGDVERARKLLAQATRLRYDGYSDAYRRLTIARHYQAVMLSFGIPILITVVALLVYSADRFENLSSGWGRGGLACVVCVALGTLGALTSAAQRSSHVEDDRVYEQFASSVNSLSRVPLGAVAGLTVWLFSLATSEGPLNAPNMLLIAFGAGFAERLVVQTAGVADNGASHKTITKRDQVAESSSAAGGSEQFPGRARPGVPDTTKYSRTTEVVLESVGQSDGGAGHRSAN